MKLVLEVEKNKAKLLMEFLRSLPYVKVKAAHEVEAPIPPLAEEMEEAVEELKQARSGKRKTRTLKEFLDEV